MEGGREKGEPRSKIVPVCPSLQTQLDGSQNRGGVSSDQPSSYPGGGFPASQVSAHMQW